MAEPVEDGVGVCSGVHDHACLQLCLCSVATGMASLLSQPGAPSSPPSTDYTYFSLETQSQWPPLPAAYLPPPAGSVASSAVPAVVLEWGEDMSLYV